MTTPQIAGLVFACIMSWVCGYCVGFAFGMNEIEKVGIERRKALKAFLGSDIFKKLKDKPLWQYTRLQDRKHK